MNIIATYVPTSLHKHFGVDNKWFVPCDEVRHSWDATAYDVVVAVVGDKITVLWSVRPLRIEAWPYDTRHVFFEPSFVVNPVVLTLAAYTRKVKICK